MANQSISIATEVTRIDSTARQRKRIKVGLLANEFFDVELGRLGGFGWVSRELARIFANPSLGVDLVYLTGELQGDSRAPVKLVHGVPLILRSKSSTDLIRIEQENIDLLLMIDYRPNYQRVCRTLIDTPKIVWVRDPRGPSEIKSVDALRLPDTDIKPKGTYQPDCRTLAHVAAQTRGRSSAFIFASSAPEFLGPRLRQMIGSKHVDFVYNLPNPISHAKGRITKATTPVVGFLGRLDPYKRPWLFVEVAHRFPDVSFWMAGHRHFFGAGSWEPQKIPPNVELLGHVDDAEKMKLLERTWVLMNTSVHEGMAVSLLEGLSRETVLLSCVDPDNVVSRFGRSIGYAPGDGSTALDALEHHLAELLESNEYRRALGEKGRIWLESHHSVSGFLSCFKNLTEQAIPLTEVAHEL